jgi:hypothetical protein
MCQLVSIASKREQSACQIAKNSESPWHLSAIPKDLAFDADKDKIGADGSEERVIEVPKAI